MKDGEKVTPKIEIAAEHSRDAAIEAAQHFGLQEGYVGGMGVCVERAGGEKLYRVDVEVSYSAHQVEKIIN